MWASGGHPLEKISILQVFHNEPIVSGHFQGYCALTVLPTLWLDDIHNPMTRSRLKVRCPPAHCLSAGSKVISPWSLPHMWSWPSPHSSDAAAQFQVTESVDSPGSWHPAPKAVYVSSPRLNTEVHRYHGPVILADAGSTGGSIVGARGSGSPWR